MERDFTKPQRQSVTGIVIMAASSLKHFIKALAIPIVIFIVKAEADVLRYVGLGVAILLVIALFFAYLSYLKFTFFLDIEREEFIINHGVFNKKLLTIPLEKIQQVNINQSLLQKIIGVYSLEIDTAGTDSKEVSIKAIDEVSAYRLKEHLLSGNKTSVSKLENEAENTDIADVPFLKIGYSTLFKVGLTSNYGSSLALMVGFGYAIFHNVKDLIRAFDKDNGQVEAAIQQGITLVSIGIIIFALLVILFVTNIVRTFVKYYDFKISNHKQSLLISSGLFTTKNTLLNPSKVQITSYSQNFFQRKFNMLNMNLKQTHSGKAQNEHDLRKSNLEVPGCNEAERDDILRMILGKIPEEKAMFTPNFRFLNLPMFFKVALPVAIYLLFYFNLPEAKQFYPLAILYAFITIPMIYVSYLRHRLFVNQTFIIKKSGIWDVSFEHIFPHKIQAITTFQYPWHKGVDVGHVNLHTAAGVIHFKYGNYTEIKKLVNYWLYQVESSEKDWM